MVKVALEVEFWYRISNIYYTVDILLNTQTYVDGGSVCNIFWTYKEIRYN